MKCLIFSYRAIIRITFIALLLFSVIFLTLQIFVEGELLSKWYAFVGGSLLCCLASLFLVKIPKIHIDLFTTFFVGYLLFLSFLSPLTLNNIHRLSLISFILLYLSFKLETYSNYLKHIDIIILAACVAQACYGLMQYFEIFQINKGFKIIGSFDNPAGFAACLSAGVPFCFSIFELGSWRRYIGVVSFAVITSSIVLSGSRSGIIAIIIVSCIYFANRYYHVLKKHLKYVILVFILLIFIGIGIFFLKKNSAIGRLLIWNNTLDMIADKPLFGYGSGGFRGNYMLYQADYFEQNPISPYSILADNVTQPFNEYLLLIVEYGIVGLLFLLVTIFIIIKSSKQTTIYHLSLLSIGIIACFSYPLHYPFVVIIIAYCVANIKSKDFCAIKTNAISKTAGVIMIGTVTLFLAKDMQFEKQWGQLVQKSNFGNYEKLLDDYEKLHSTWNGNPMFLYNYGAILNRAEEYEKSNEVFFDCKKYLNDYDVQMLIADNYSKLGQWNNAEFHYKRAHNMNPSKFMPLYKLMLLYEITENKYRSLKMANTITNKVVKIPSATVTHIKNKAQKISDKN